MSYSGDYSYGSRSRSGSGSGSGWSFPSLGSMDSFSGSYSESETYASDSKGDRCRMIVKRPRGRRGFRGRYRGANPRRRALGGGKGKGGHGKKAGGPKNKKPKAGGRRK